MPKLAEIARMDTRTRRVLAQAIEQAIRHAREREEQWERQRLHRLIERLMRQRRAAGE